MEKEKQMVLMEVVPIKDGMPCCPEDWKLVPLMCDEFDEPVVLMFKLEEAA